MSVKMHRYSYDKKSGLQLILKSVTLQILMTKKKSNNYSIKKQNQHSFIPN